MFLRWSNRKKNGKDHRYWSIVENKRCAGRQDCPAPCANTRRSFCRSMQLHPPLSSKQESSILHLVRVRLLSRKSSFFNEMLKYYSSRTLRLAPKSSNIVPKPPPLGTHGRKLVV